MATTEQILEILHLRAIAVADPDRLEAVARDIANLDCACAKPEPGYPSPPVNEMCPIHGRYSFEDLTRMLMMVHQITLGNVPTVGLADIPTVQLLAELNDRAMNSEARRIDPVHAPTDQPDF